jgi:hypothetical protein|tara:strand:- start:847 stop:1404 length:558 start_codon:yes stop_codon:yes gene_type:complete
MEETRTKVSVAREVFSELNADTTVDSAVRMVRDYWSHPDNLAARTQEATRQESEEYRSSFIARYDRYLPGVIDQAESIPEAWDGLRNEVRRRVEHGKDVPKEAMLLLLRPQGRPVLSGRPKGTTLGDNHRDHQLVLAIHYLWKHGGFALSTNSVKAKNAFSVVELATGQTFDSVRTAWRRRILFK